jgi:hypothetical protein
MRGLVGLTTALGITAALFVAGCGTGEQHFRLKPTRDCLKAHGFRTVTANNRILKPSEGSVGAAFGGGQYVELEFGKDAREALSIRNSLRNVGGKNWPVGARANVAYVWSAHAQDRVKGVLGCLRN